MDNTSTDLVPRVRPRGELFAHPEVALVWAAIGALDPGLCHVLYEHLGEHLAMPEAAGSRQERRLARALAALREAADLLAEEGMPRLVSIVEYRRLRQLHPEWGWPADGSIRRWAGGRWNDALERAGLQPVAEGDMLVSEVGVRFVPAELIEALQDYVRDTGDLQPAYERYIAWAKRPDVKARPGRRPLSPQPFQRAFGTWLRSLDAADLYSVAAVSAGAGKSQPVVRPLLIRARPSYSESDVHDALRLVATRVGRSPTRTEYCNHRRVMLEEDLDARRPLRCLPTVGVMQGLYKTWDEGLIAAGLPPRNGRHDKNFPPASPRNKRYTNDEALAAIRLARTELEGRMTLRAYLAWRLEAMDAADAAGTYLRLPAEYGITQRFGSWVAAVELALSPSKSGGEKADVA